MNPFEDDDNNEILNNNIQITIWIIVTGSKTNTYISGWNISDNELKDHIKNIKKKNGCNGSIKDIMNDKEIPIKTIHLQGNHIDFMKDYLIQNGVNPNDIYIKG